MKKLEREGPLILTYQLMEELRKLVVTQYKPDDLFLSDKEIVEKYGVSVITARNAVENLMSEDLLVRKRGKGIFLADKKTSNNITVLQNGTELLEAMGIENTIEPIPTEQVKADYLLSRRFEVPFKTELHKLVRARKIAGIPYSIETNYFTTETCRDIIRLYQGNFLYVFLKDMYDICALKSHETYNAVLLDEEHAKLLDQKKKSPAFHMEGKVYDQYDRLISLEEGIYKADKYEIVVDTDAGQRRATYMIGERRLQT